MFGFYNFWFFDFDKMTELRVNKRFGTRFDQFPGSKITKVLVNKRFGATPGSLLINFQEINNFKRKWF